MKRIIAEILMVVLLIGQMHTAMADMLFSANFSSAQNGAVPAEFDRWKGGNTTLQATIETLAGLFGKAESDISSAIVSAADVTSAYKPYVRKSITAAGEVITLSFNIAAEDKNSEKAVYVTNSTSALGDKSKIALVMSQDGKMYSFGTELTTYNTRQWYHIDIEISNDSFKTYVNGEYKTGGTVPSGTVASTMYLYYSMYDKAAGTEAIVYVDDFEMTNEELSQDRKTDVITDYVMENGWVKNVDSNKTVSEFLSEITPVGTAVITLEDVYGATVSEGTLSAGMSIVIKSADGINCRRYLIECFDFVFNAPEDGSLIKKSTQLLSVSFGGAATVEFYVNDTLYDTVTQAPYETEVVHTKDGNYTVYAKIVIGDTTMQTESITYTYRKNIPPVVKVRGVDDGAELSVDEPLTITVTGTDEDGTIDTAALVIDGERIEKTDNPAVFTINNLTLGRHQIYAEVTDNDGESVQSSVFSIICLNRKNIIIDDADFDTDKTTNWSELDSSYGSIETMDEGKCFVFRTNGVPTTYLYSSGNINFTKNTTWFELDFKVSSTTVNTELIAIRGSSSDYYDYGMTISGGNLEGYPIEAEKWYHIKFSWNMPEKTTRLWVLEDGAYKMIKENTMMNTDGTFSNMRMLVNTSKTPDEYYLALDNLCLYYIEEAPYVKDIEYLDESGTSVFDGSTVGCKLKTVSLKLNNEMNVDDITKDNVKVFANDTAVIDYEVSYSDKSILITFGSPVRTLCDYRIEYKDMKDKSGAVLPDGVCYFKTGAAEYDVLEWTVKKGGTPLASLNNIQKGDELVLSAEMRNATAMTQNSKLIFAVYSGDRLIGYSIKDVSVPVGGGTFSSDILTVSGAVDDTVSVRGFMWSSIGPDRNIQTNGFAR